MDFGCPQAYPDAKPGVVGMPGPVGPMGPPGPMGPMGPGGSARGQEYDFSLFIYIYSFFFLSEKHDPCESQNGTKQLLKL